MVIIDMPPLSKYCENESITDGCGESNIATISVLNVIPINSQFKK